MFLVTAGTGKTGRRVAQRLQSRGLPVRVGSRSAQPAFDWTRPETWPAALDGVRAVYVAYQPDLAAPGAPDVIRAFVEQAAGAGVRTLVLLTGRGEEEAVVSERIVQKSGLDHTILRASWFAQNFSEDFMAEPVTAGELTLPAGDAREPFLDVEDLADVAVEALADPARHSGELYELTGPRLLTFAEAVQEIGRAAGRPLRYTPISLEELSAGLAADGVPAGMIELYSYLFGELFDGRNEHLSDGVQRALGRAPRDFADYARATAATGVWRSPAAA